MPSAREAPHGRVVCRVGARVASEGERARDGLNQSRKPSSRDVEDRVFLRRGEFV